MAGDSKIEWTDATWNPTRGCSVCSPGCKHCYAMKVAARFSGPGLAYEGLAFMHSKAGGQWTGEVRMVEDQLDAPLRWSRPRRIFVNSMSDLFHEALSIETIARVFAVMYLAPRHTFQVLTKRAARMREVLNDSSFYRLVLTEANNLRRDRPKLMGIGISDPTKHPAPWVHLGVSVEDQKRANERIPELLGTPAAVRFLSCEPLLEEVRLGLLRNDTGYPADCVCGHGHAFTRCPNTGGVEVRCYHEGCSCHGFNRRPGSWNGIDWVIVGGESGRDARPFWPAWARSILRQCKHAGVKAFVKQLGADIRTRNDDHLSGGREDDPPGWDLQCEDDVEENLHGYREDHQGAEVRIHLKNKKGGDPAEWPADLRVREFPEVRR